MTSTTDTRTPATTATVTTMLATFEHGGQCYTIAIETSPASAPGAMMRLPERVNVVLRTAAGEFCKAWSRGALGTDAEAVRTIEASVRSEW
jgi:hypothetical protein